MSDQIMPRPDTRFPIERRRATSGPSSALGIVDRAQAYTRRETDAVRIRIQHWMELADAALKSNPLKRRRSH